jgi:hypothetical protein
MCAGGIPDLALLCIIPGSLLTVLICMSICDRELQRYGNPPKERMIR